jgi:hypothetical protein
MRRVNQEWIVIDNQSNTVGFMRSDSLAIVNSKSYETEGGYLNGCLGVEYKGKKYIYLWFSSNYIVLLDGLTLN